MRLADADQRFPDFHLRSDGVDYEFEFTEALPPDRKRGDEYRDWASARTALRPYHAVDRNEGLEIIAEAIRRKANKFYATNPHLLVYADFSGEGIDLRECQACFENECARFASVWILMTLSVAKLSDAGAFRDYADLTPFPFERAGV